MKKSVKPTNKTKLRKAGDAFLDTRHTDEDHTSGAFVKDRSHLLKAADR